jgi:hypothetical protein
VVSNLFSLLASYWVYGKRILSWRQLLPMPLEAPAPAAKPAKEKRADIVAGESDYEISEEDQEPDITDTREARSPHGRKRRGQRKKRR